MAKPAWRDVTTCPVSAGPNALWTLAVDHVDSGRLLKLTVPEVPAVAKPGAPPPAEGATVPQMWQPSKGESVNADGFPVVKTRPGLLLASAPRGALIGKIGGGTADVPQPAGTEDLNASQPKLFAVGSHCVIEVGTKGGPLYLAMNDDLENFTQHEGTLNVKIEES
jgi:hypothetical protein